MAALFIRRRRIVLSTFVLGSAVFVAVAMLKPPTYTAVATLVVRPNVAYTPVSDDAGTAIVTRDVEYRQIEPEINATIALLESPSLMDRALALIAEETSDDESVDAGFFAGALRMVKRGLGYPGRLYRSLHDVPKLDPAAARVEKARAGLRVEPVEKSNLIEVSFTDARPGRAADTLNGLLSAYLSPRATTSISADALRFFEEQRELLAERSSAAKTELRSFLTSEGRELPFENEDDVRKIWLELLARRTAADAELAEATSRLEKLTEETAALPDTLPVAAQAEQSDAVRVLKARVAELELARSALLAQWSPTSAFVRDADRQIETARRLLAAEKKSATSTFSGGGAAMQDLTMQLVDARTRKAQIESRLKALDSEIAEYAGKLDQLDRLAPEHRRLKARASAMEDAYITYLKKEEEARFSNALREASIMNVEIAEAAGVPVRPDPSGKTLVVLLGVIVSLGLGLAAGLARDRLDPALATAAEVEVLSGLPSVGGDWAALPFEAVTVDGSTRPVLISGR
jgi:uncharacterized protein involved in exopolysaccharide biosynthesis